MPISEKFRTKPGLKNIYLALVLTLFCSYAFCQSTKISGNVKDVQGKPIGNANVTIIDAAGKILSFKFSDNVGNFNIQLSDSAYAKGNLSLKVSAFGFASVLETLAQGKITYLFSLKYQQLEEVNVFGIQRVKKKGDTTSFSVKAFEGKEDRSIGDVISKIPGMSVDENGKIKYRERDVKGLYIQGDDLLSTNYGVGTTIISKEMIKSIEVIEHFQPVRVLKDKVGTNDVVINLVLQDENAINISGQSSAGAGFPGLLDLSANAVLFNKRIKELAVLKYNNTGKSFVNRDFEDLLSDAIVDNPGIPAKYVNKNNSLFNSANLLLNFKDSLQLKGNMQFANDRNAVNYSSMNRNFLDVDTVDYAERQTSLKKPIVFSLALSLEQNKTSRFLSNMLSINLGGTTNQSIFSLNERDFKQLLRSQEQSISNQLVWMPAIRKRNSFNVEWKISYRHRPQTLLVAPGIDSTLLNNGINYHSAFQNIKKQSFNNEVAFNYFVNDKKLIRKSFTLGITNEFQSLYSSINLAQFDGSSVAYAGDVGNNVIWQQHKEYIAAGFFIKKQKINAFLTVPIEFQQIYFKQNTEFPTKANNNLYVSPNLLVNYSLNAKNTLNFSYNLNNSFGTINNIYTGTIIRSFKELRSNSNDFIQEVKQHKVDAGYVFNNALKLFEMTAGISYLYRRANSIYSTKYESNILTTFLLPYQADQSTVSYQTSVSKYVYFLKSKFELKGMYSETLTDQVVNNSFLPYLNKNWNTRLTMGCSLLEYISLYYSGSGNWYASHPKKEVGEWERNTSKVSIFNHNYSLVITPKLPLNVILQGRQQLNNFDTNTKKEYFFVDVMLRYHFAKRKIELEMEVNNLFDIETFGTYYLATNQSFSSTYQLRGRLTLMKVNFFF